jgi:glutamate-ammonia-ligase adenylyltransferase
LGGSSAYLADLALREAATLRRVARLGPDPVMADILTTVDALRPTVSRPHIVAALRQAKRQAALTIALADLAGFWNLEQVTAALSALAEACLSRACAHLLRTAHDGGTLVLPHPEHPERGSGLIVLGMGKLGARELNYSSDIDLILLYDPDAFPGDADLNASLGGVFARIARGLVDIMEARNADGYVFRTDLRLRPDPASTPPCVALPAALAYYEAMGQNWERAAMIKARPVAGDIPRGQAFLGEIRPFIWRRHLDFAAIADLQSMKQRVDLRHGGKGSGLLGFDVKLGRGGIREAEFVAQTLQLVWGGRYPALRQPQTRAALHALADAGRLPQAAAQELDGAYVVLRGIEHRLQMVADRQTHALPATEPELDRFARFAGFADTPAFGASLRDTCDTVHSHWEAVMEGVPAPPEGVVLLNTAGPGDLAPEDVVRLAGIGYRDPAAVVALARGWRAGRLRALRSPRARELLEAVLPGILAAAARQQDADAALSRLDQLLARLPAGVQLLSLFHRNPALLDRVMAVLGAAPSLADHLAAVPAALEGLLEPDDAGWDPGATLLSQLEDASTLEDAVAIARRTVRGEEFRLAVAQMEGRIGADEAGLRRTALADAALSALLPRILDDHATRYGRVPRGAMAVVLLGKGGGREMLAGSDLDLLLIYDHPADVLESRARPGQRSLPASQWFIRAAHALVAALTAPGIDGPLYAVDMRLRPSGNKGPVAVPLQGFVRYQAEDAWTWERMALTRARVVAGPPALCRRVRAAIRTALLRDVGREVVLADTAAMQARVRRDLPPSGPWDVKHRPGGQMTVEFIAQGLQLAAGPARRRVLHTTTRTALHALAGEGLLPPADLALLVRADLLWRTVQGMRRILVGRDPVANLPAPAAATLAAACANVVGGAVDVAALRLTMDGVAAQVEDAFARLVEQT